MEREQLDRLLAEYATGGLSEEQKKQLFAAALSDQELFDQLMEEDALREVIAMPGVRDRLIDALQEEAVPALRAASMAAPAPAPVRAPARMAPRTPVWYAWAAGLGVVFLSGVISYVLLDRGQPLKLAQVLPHEEAKPFVPPPAPAAAPAAPRKIVVEAPPVMEAKTRKPETLPAANIPLPSAPPPPAPQPQQQPAKEMVALAKDRADAVKVTSEVAPLRMADNAVAAGASAPARAPAARAALAERMAPPAVWRRTGDGVWVRLEPTATVGRDETLVIRHTPQGAAAVTLLDATGAVVARRTGRAGVEMEFAVPRALLERAREGELTLTLSEGATPVKIVLRIR